MRKLDGVAIYLDTNVMYGWHTFAELDRLALTILASELGQEIIIPSLVARNSRGTREGSSSGRPRSSKPPVVAPSGSSSSTTS